MLLFELAFILVNTCGSLLIGFNGWLLRCRQRLIMGCPMDKTATPYDVELKVRWFHNDKKRLWTRLSSISAVESSDVEDGIFIKACAMCESGLITSPNSSLLHLIFALHLFSRGNMIYCLTILNRAKHVDSIAFDRLCQHRHERHLATAALILFACFST